MNPEYLIVGGTALFFYGHYRMTRQSDNLFSEKHDFDFWYNPSYTNYYNLLNALSHLEIDVKEFKEEQSPNPKKSYFTHEFEKFEVDFLPEIIGLSKFRDSFSERNVSLISIISKQDLIKSKEFIGRKKDLDDLNELRQLFPEE